ncbi:MAG: hypothetical protein AB9835_01275 [Eubacteriales bacterium]
MILPDVKYGDVFKLPLKNGFGLIQCVEETDVTQCEIIRVLSGIYDENEIITNYKDILRQKEAFFTSIPLKYALKSRYIKFVINAPVPKCEKLHRYFE